MLSLHSKNKKMPFLKSLDFELILDTQITMFTKSVYQNQY